MNQEPSDARGLEIALIAFAGLFAAQLFAFIFTHILVLYTESLHSLGDTMITGSLLAGFFWSRKPPDEYHMFGHGRAQNAVALVVATIFIFFMSLETFRNAISELSEPRIRIQDTSLAFAIAVATMIVLAIPLITILRTKARGASSKAQLFALFEDEIAGAAALIGVVLVANGFVLADPITSMVVGAAIAVVGLYLLKDNFDYLLGRSPGREFMDKVEVAAKSIAGVLSVHDLRAEYVGPNIINATFHIDLAKETSVEEAARILREVKEKVSQMVACQYCIVQVDPAT